jgi:2,3-bisphosphoglycerate-independent phosphoglycerate mutase
MKKVILCILDGVGIRESSVGNAFKNTNKPTFDYLWNNYPHTLLEASGKLVGLPEGQMGNSEVGHTNIGAGRIVYQSLELINKSIEDKTFFENKELKEAINHCKENNSNLHLMGLVSNGGVHSELSHLLALLDLCKQEGFHNVYIDAFTDGRDTSPKIALEFFKELDNKLKEIGFGKITTISGRFYAMDRDNRWERIKKAYDVIVSREGEEYNSYEEAIQANYQNNITDEFIVPCYLTKEGQLEDNDSVVVFNFRPDRLRELFKAISNPTFNEFEHKDFKNIKLVTMMLVSDEVICTNAFQKQILTNTLGEYLSKNNISQLRIAETEKYAHVTYFFDGGEDRELPNCNRILIPSPKVATYDLKPEMSAKEITDNLLKIIPEQKYQVIILNYANGDMVGHTGVMEAVEKAVITLDNSLRDLYKVAKDNNYTLIVTADHGNCEEMLESDGITPHKKHTTNLVPFIVCNKDIELTEGVGKLSDIAPTILKLMDLEIPEEMTGNILIK